LICVSSIAMAALPVPAPSVDVPSTNKGRSGSYSPAVALGCVGVFRHVKGVERQTGMQVYDQAPELRAGRQRLRRPRGIGGGDLRSDQVSYGQLPRVFFSVAHDPTQINRQGPTPARRSFGDLHVNDEQQRGQPIAQLDAAKASRGRRNTSGPVDRVYAGVLPSELPRAASDAALHRHQ
jgi:peptide-methionine (S)-S-oxide reductase